MTSALASVVEASGPGTVISSLASAVVAVGAVELVLVTSPECAISTLTSEELVEVCCV